MQCDWYRTQIHPITCSRQHSDRDRTLNPSPFFLAHPKNDNGMSCTCTEGYLFHRVKCSENQFFFGAQTWVPGIGNTYGMNVLVPVRAQMRRWCFEPFWTNYVCNDCKARTNYGDTTSSYRISRRDYQTLKSTQQTTYSYCTTRSNTEILLAAILWRNHLLSTKTADLVLVPKHP